MHPSWHYWKWPTSSTSWHYKSLQSLHWEHTHDITVSLPFQLIGQWLLKRLTSPWDIPHTMPQFVWRARAFYLWKSLGWDTSNMGDVWIRYPQYAGKLQGSHACVNKQQYWDALDTISKKHGTLVWSGGPWMYDIYFPTISRLALLSKIRAPFFGKKSQRVNPWSFDPRRTVDTNINVYIYIYTYTWNPNDSFFGWKRLWFGDLTFKIEVIGAPCIRIVNRLLHRPCGTLSIPGCNQLGYSGSTRRLLGPQNPSTCPNTPTRLTGGYLHSWVYYKTIYVYNLNEYIST